jgi:flagellar hook assembly protein FlgD
MQLRLLFTSLTLAAFIYTQAQNTSPYWSLAGNSAATTSSKLGTTNAVDLKLYTNNSARLTILGSNGYVGIGTTAPTSRFTINATSSPLRASINGATKLYIGTTGGLSVGSGTSAPANGLYVAGNVGIGTEIPEQKLHVLKGSAGSVTGYENAPLIVENATNSYVNILAPDANETGILFGKPASNVSGGIVYNNSGTPNGLQFRTAGNITRMTLSSSGNLALGTNTPFGYRLEVHGQSLILNEGGNYGIRSKASTLSSMSGKGVIGDGYIGVYGNGTQYGIYGYSQTGWAGYFSGPVFTSGSYNASARKLKQNITDLTSAMALISKLKPKEYEYKQDGAYKSMNLPKGKRYGLIAEELEEVFPNLIKAANFDSRLEQSLDATENRQAPASVKIDFKAVNYTELIPIMIKGMQEQEKEKGELKEEVQDLKGQIAELRKMVLELKNGRTGSVSLTSAYLEQNTPNPVSGTTTIRYHVPETSTSARLTLTNAKGQVVKTVSLNNKGTGQLSLSTISLAAGTYNYTLYVDGKQADTKRLIIAR